MHRCAVARRRLADHPRAERPGDRRGAVGRPVVDDDDAEHVGHPAEEVRQGGCLIPARQHQVASSHASTLGTRRRGVRRKPLRECEGRSS